MVSHEQWALILFLVGLSGILYLGYDHWRQKSKGQTREIDFKEKDVAVTKEAMNAHETAKELGPEALSDDTDRMLGL